MIHAVVIIFSILYILGGVCGTVCSLVLSDDNESVQAQRFFYGSMSLFGAAFIMLMTWVLLIGFGELRI